MIVKLKCIGIYLSTKYTKIRNIRNLELFLFKSDSLHYN